VQAQGRADANVTAAGGEAESNVIRAKAEAEALGLIAAQLKDNPNLLTYRYIERLAPGVQTIILPSNQPFLLDPKSFIGPASTTSTTTEPSANGVAPTPAPQPLAPAVEPTPAPTSVPAP
jgi:hypothetical protein